MFNKSWNQLNPFRTENKVKKLILQNEALYNQLSTEQSKLSESIIQNPERDSQKLQNKVLKIKIEGIKDEMEKIANTHLLLRKGIKDSFSFDSLYLLQGLGTGTGIIVESDEDEQKLFTNHMEKLTYPRHKVSEEMNKRQKYIRKLQNSRGTLLFNTALLRKSESNYNRVCREFITSNFDIREETIKNIDDINTVYELIQGISSSKFKHHYHIMKREDYVLITDIVTEESFEDYVTKNDIKLIIN